MSSHEYVKISSSAHCVPYDQEGLYDSTASSAYRPNPASPLISIFLSARTVYISTVSFKMSRTPQSVTIYDQFIPIYSMAVDPIQYLIADGHSLSVTGRFPPTPREMSRTSQSLPINDIYRTIHIDAVDPAGYLINDGQSLYATEIGNLPITPREMSRTSQSVTIDDEYRRKYLMALESARYLENVGRSLPSSINLRSTTREFPRFSSQPTSYHRLRNNYTTNKLKKTKRTKKGKQALSHPNTFPSQRAPTMTPKKDFEIFLDVHEYKPEELKVKCVDDFIIIDGKHPERMDPVSLVSQQFTRKYEIPKDIDKGNIICFLSSDALLYIFAPSILKKKEIPIIAVNKPSTSISGNAKVFERNFLEEVIDQSEIRKTSQDSTEAVTVEESVSPQSEGVPETMEQDEPEKSTN